MQHHLNIAARRWLPRIHPTLPDVGVLLTSTQGKERPINYHKKAVCSLKVNCLFHILEGLFLFRQISTQQIHETAVHDRTTNHGLWSFCRNERKHNSKQQ